MRTTADNLTTTQVFSLRDRARVRGDRELVRTCDRWLETQSEGALLVILQKLADEDSPSVVSLRFQRGTWHTFELYTAEDVELLNGAKPVRAIYVRGIYSVEDIRHLPLIEQRLRDVLGAMQAEGCQVEWYLDRA